jgi:hypothetical protein
MKNLKYTVTVLVLFIFVLAGCGKKTDQQQTNTTGDNKQLNQDVKVENKDVPTNKTDDSKKDGKNELGIKEGLPADYPKDLPQPKNSKVLGSLNTSEGTTVTFESTEKPMDLLKDFGDNVEKIGFKKADGEQMKEEGGMSMWKKEAREVSLMLAWDKEKKISSVVVTYK